MRRRWIVGGVVAAVGAAAIGVTLSSSRTSTASSGIPPASAARQTAKVIRTDLVDENKLAGTLGYGEVRTIGGGITGAQRLRLGDERVAEAVVDGTLDQYA